MRTLEEARHEAVRLVTRYAARDRVALPTDRDLGLEKPAPKAHPQRILDAAEGDLGLVAACARRDNTAASARARDVAALLELELI